MSGVLPLGPVPASGRLEVTVDTRTQGATAGPHPIGCLDRAALDTAVRHLTTTGATKVTAGGHTIEATLPKDATGTAVFAMTAVPGWQCDAPLRPFHGLVAVALPRAPPSSPAPSPRRASPGPGRRRPGPPHPGLGNHHHPPPPPPARASDRLTVS